LSDETGKKLIFAKIIKNMRKYACG